MRFIYDEDGYINIQFKSGKEILIGFINEWHQLFASFNWSTYTLVKIEFEDDACMGAYCVDVILLGLGFTFRYNHTETEQMTRIKEACKDIEDGTAKYKTLHDVERLMDLKE